MRLLKTNEAGEIGFAKDYVRETPPPYAILSHTWGEEDEEVTFQDIKSGTGQKKAGYQKIKFCGAQALRDGLAYFWVDTCCIDKTNSVSSTKPSTPCFDDDGEAYHRAWMAEFTNSRWFSRGWTLQELLAPESVEFFSREGRLLGSKRFGSLEEAIYERTRIPHAALHGRIAEFPVEQRLQWQKDRSTKREEDEAYSLLGICDVSLPLIYGEGKTKAFKRLRRELAFTGVDLSLPVVKYSPYESWMTKFDSQLIKFNDFAQAQKTFNRISPYRPLPTLNRVQSRRLEGTLGWLVHNESFLRWESSSSDCRCLWLLGKIGSGKTVIMATAVQHLISVYKYDHTMPTLHYFFEYPCASAVDLFRSLAKQLIQILIDRNQQCPNEVVRELSACFGDESRLPDLHALINFVVMPLMTRFRRLTFCIDGVDECDFDEKAKIREGLARISRDNCVRMLISGEDQMMIPGLLPDTVLNIRLDGKSPLHESCVKAEVLRDIETYIETRLGQLSGPDNLFNDVLLRQRVKSALIERSDCMFLWVCLQMEILTSCETPDDVIAVLDDLPPTLEETYLRCLTRRRRGKLICKIKILNWAILAEVPMTMEELQGMVAVNPLTGQLDRNKRPSPESIKNSTVSLISFEGVERLLLPVHHSVRQFLLSQARWIEHFQSLCGDRLTDWQFCHSLYAIHTLVSSEDQLLGEDQPAGEIGRISLLHIRHCTGLEITKQHHLQTPPIAGMIPTGLQKILGIQPRISVQLPRPDIRSRLRENDDDAFLRYAIRTWTAHTKYLTADNSIWHDFQEVALQPNLSYRVHPWSSIGGTEISHLRGLLGFAVSQNHVPLLLLLETRASALPRDIFDHALPGNGLLPALHVAAEAGFVEIVGILLRWCKVNALSAPRGRTALHYAAENGHEDVVKLLCKARGVRLDLVDNEGRTSASLARENCHSTISLFLTEAQGIKITAEHIFVTSEVVMSSELLSESVQTDKDGSV